MNYTFIVFYYTEFMANKICMYVCIFLQYSWYVMSFSIIVLSLISNLVNILRLFFLFEKDSYVHLVSCSCCTASDNCIDF